MSFVEIAHGVSYTLHALLTSRCLKQMNADLLLWGNGLADGAENSRWMAELYFVKMVGASILV